MSDIIEWVLELEVTGDRDAMASLIEEMSAATKRPPGVNRA